MFNLDFQILVRLLTPTFLRRKRMLSWLAVLITPIVNLYYRFVETRNYDLFRESINSTIPRLEYLLNYTFYPAGLNTDYNNRIRISLHADTNPKPIYLGGITQPVDEEKPQYLGTLYINTGAETGALNVDFTVSVPLAAQPYDSARMESLIRSYALPDKTFNIVNLS